MFPLACRIDATLHDIDEDSVSSDLGSSDSEAANDHRGRRRKLRSQTEVFDAAPRVKTKSKLKDERPPATPGRKRSFGGRFRRKSDMRSSSQDFNVGTF